MSTCEPKSWNEYPPGSRLRSDALVQRAYELGHRSISAVASFSGLTADEAEEALARLSRSGRIPADNVRRLWRQVDRRDRMRLVLW